MWGGSPLQRSSTRSGGSLAFWPRHRRDFIVLVASGRSLRLADMVSNERVVVLLGAGASHDCVSVEPSSPRVRDWRPPLVTELFSPRFEDVLLRYPMVHNAAPEIRHATTLGKPAQIGLEDYLRTAFRDSNDFADQRTMQLYRCISKSY